jgi:hypothetical protein
MPYPSLMKGFGLFFCKGRKMAWLIADNCVADVNHLHCKLMEKAPVAPILRKAFSSLFIAFLA